MSEFRAVEFKGMGSFFWIDGDTLMGCEERDFRKAGGDAEGAYAWGVAYEVTAPESQDFLDVVNAVFGTDFLFDSFAGR